MRYAERARRPPRRVRIRRTRVAGILVVIAAIVALSLYWRASSSSRDSASFTAAGPVRVSRGERPAPLSETGGAAATGRLGLGEADGAVPEGTTVFDDEVPGVAKLNSDLLGVVRRAATDAAGDGVRFYVDSGWRSSEYQERLLREAISKLRLRSGSDPMGRHPETRPRM